MYNIYELFFGKSEEIKKRVLNEYVKFIEINK